MKPLKSRYLILIIPLCVLAAAATTMIDPARSIKWPPCSAGQAYAPNGNSCFTPVSSIDSQTGAFTFSGAGVSHIGNAYTFSGGGGGGGVTSVGMTVPSWLSVAGSPITTSGTLGVTAATGQTSHQVIGTCGSGTSFGPCSLVAGDIPNIAESQVTNLITDLAAKVANTTTVNGHPLSSNVIVSASDLTSGTLPHAQLPALLSGDIPNNAANTSGTSGGFTGNPNASITNLTILGTCTGCPGIGGAITASSVTVTGYIATNVEFSLGTCTTAKTINPANGNRQKVTLTNGSTCALTFTQPASGTSTVQIKITQSAVSTFNGGISGCKWPGGVTPTITQTTGAVDMISAYLDGTTAYCQTAQAFQ